MERSVSITIGDGNINHNNRVFITDNVDKSRTANNITFVKENIEDVYHELFDTALKNYNAKQTRKDRRIEDYYKHICNGKQEKPFFELIIQIGNKDDTSVNSETGNLTTEILKEYAKDFERNNPHLKVCNLVIHLDESSPHIHLDFIPFATEQKRGLSTRVSLSKALEQQGFKSKGKNNLCTNQWIDSEKERLSTIMKRYGIEWEKLGTHNEHLSVLDYKKKQRQKEIEELEKEVVETKERLTSENKHSVALRQKSRREYAFVQKSKAEADKAKKEAERVKREAQKTQEEAALRMRVANLNSGMIRQISKLNADTNRAEKEKLKSEYEYFLQMKEKFREYAQTYINTIKDEQIQATRKTELNKQLNSFGDNESLDEYVQRITQKNKQKQKGMSL